MATIKELKRRLDSVKSSRKITGAMRMIASARLKKAGNALGKAQSFEEQLQSVFDHIDLNDSKSSLLEEERSVANVALVVLGSDEGLSGAFNINITKEMVAVVGEYNIQLKTPVQLYAIGRRLNSGIKKLKNIEQRNIPEQITQKNYPDGIRLLAVELIERFLKKEIDRVDVIYTHFKSMGKQVVKRKQLLPLHPPKESIEREKGKDDFPEQQFYYIYEPDVKTIIEKLLPMVVRIALYKCMLENKNSEEAMRVVSMQTANDNANKLIDKLQLEYNKLRQQNITTELLDITGGAVTE